MKRMNLCEVCGNKTNNEHYCSMKCRDISRRRNAIEIRKCENCGKGFQVYKKFNQKYCSVKCAGSDEKLFEQKIKKSKQTKLEKYGDENYVNLEKIKKTCLKKYGVNSFSKTDEFKEKFEKTNLERYGTKYPQQNEEIKEKSKKTFEKSGGYPMQSGQFQKNMIKKYGVNNSRHINGVEEKIKQTNLKKYGTEYGLQNKSVIDKRIKTLLEKYGVDNISKVFDIKEKRKFNQIKKFYESLFNSDRLRGKALPLFTFEEYLKEGSSGGLHLFKCNKCGNNFIDNLKCGKIPRCLICYPSNNISKPEKEVLEYIQQLLSNIEIIANTKKIILPLELDIYIPNKKLAIEYNGLYHHSELRGTNKYYHLNKTKMCEQKGIQLIHIFDDDWFNKQDIVKLKLKHMLGISDKKIYARNCEIKEIDSKTKNEFLRKYHIQGVDKSNIKLGLFYQDELISVMTFGKQRFGLKSRSKNNEFELNRFATKENIIGGMLKLLEYFIKNYNPEKIVSYVDRCWSNGKLYEKLNFTKVSDGTPNYWYMENYSERLHRFNYRKSVLQEKLETFNSNLTEWENMQLNGYDRIWDCGSLKYEYVSKRK